MTQIIKEVKAVKNSVFIREGNGDFVALHYDSEIFRAGYPIGGHTRNITKQVVKKLYVPSVTSSKMARRCFEHVFGHVPSAIEWKQLKEEFKQ